MSDHDDWVDKGFCQAIYTDTDDAEHWCRLWPDHDDPHVAPWDYSFPRSESMVRWTGEDDAPQDVEYAVWKPLVFPTSLL